MLVNELECFIGFIPAVGIGTAPAPLFEDQYEFVTVLKDRVADRAGFDASGVHFKSTAGAKGSAGMGFEDKSLFGSADYCVGDEDFGIF